MKTIILDGVEYTAPAIKAVKGPVIQITEGPYQGVWFTVDNMRMDDVDSSLMHYDLHVAGASIDEIKPTIDSIIIHILQEEIERAHEDPPAF